MTDTGRSFPRLRQVVVDGEDARGLAEFWRQLLGLHYLPGDEPPPPGEPDPHGSTWVVLCDASGLRQLAFQQVPDLPRPTWPTGPRPQMLHLDVLVLSLAELDAEHERVLSLGAELLEDRAQDPDEPLRVYADPAGHPFCLFVGTP